MRRIEIVGTRVGRLSVIAEASPSASGRRRVLCECDCGKQKVVQVNNLRLTKGATQSCGCVRPGQRVDVQGQRFGRLVVVADAEPYRSPGGYVNRRVTCRCDCGEQAAIVVSALRTGKTRSCGCLKRDLTREASGPASPNWIGDEAGYKTSHRRVREARGPAREHPCVEEGCDRRAVHWAYRHGSDGEIWETVRDNRDKTERPMAFSRNIDDYDPMCIRHHMARDYSASKTRQQDLLRQVVVAIFALGRSVGALQPTIGGTP